ncbi:MAG: hypothetical protein SAJ37_23725 [Oscillatoria sp. PMC 1068.18]|nr:hypothetical protein [Oscillatoria sp. PMC 1076.18]MEC4991757.1 hypothetical protein [Oscillatoria sp. PMC 1068.18]
MIDEVNESPQESSDFLNTSATEKDSSIDRAESPNVDSRSVQKNVKNFQRIYIILVVGGLIIGGFVAWGVVSALSRLGLTDSQPQIQQTR